MHRRQLPILSPCPESFDAMSGTDSVRHCDSCDEDVHELSTMSPEDAHAFLREHGAKQPCVRYRFDHLGRIVFAAALGLSASGCLTGKVSSDTEPPDEPQVEQPEAEQPAEPEASEPAEAATSTGNASPVPVQIPTNRG